jgi:hypothetical protein
MSTGLLLQQVIKGFGNRAPMLFGMATDFSTASPLRLNETVTAKIRTKPTAATYSTSTGYANGATEARSLLVDLPILVDGHTHVPIEASHIYLIADQVGADIPGAVTDAVEVLADTVVSSVLAKAKGCNFSYSETYSTANSDYDAIAAINRQMNINGASPTGRIGIVNSYVAETLGADSRVASKDYYGQLADGQNSLRVFRGVGGFSAIYEWPDLSTNNGSGKEFTTTHASELVNCTGHGFKTGDRVRLTTSAADLPNGYAVDTTYYVIYVSADTLKLASSDANATAGTAVSISDDGTGTHTITGYENVTGVFFERRAFAVRAGIPAASFEAAAALGITPSMQMEVMTDPATGLSMALMKWMQAGTADLFLSPTMLYGSAAGRQAGAAAAITDKAACLLRSA